MFNADCAIVIGSLVIIFFYNKNLEIAPKIYVTTVIHLFWNNIKVRLFGNPTAANGTSWYLQDNKNPYLCLSFPSNEDIVHNVLNQCLDHIIDWRKTICLKLFVKKMEILFEDYLSVQDLKMGSIHYSQTSWFTVFKLHSSLET